MSLCRRSFSFIQQASGSSIFLLTSQLKTKCVICSSESPFWIRLALVHLVQFCEQSQGYSCWSLGLEWTAAVKVALWLYVFFCWQNRLEQGTTSADSCVCASLTCESRAYAVHSVSTETRGAAGINHLTSLYCVLPQPRPLRFPSPLLG